MMQITDGMTIFVMKGLSSKSRNDSSRYSMNFLEINGVSTGEDES